MIVRGKAFDGKTSAIVDQQMDLAADGMARLRSPDANDSSAKSFSADQLTISHRVADTPRRVRFPDGAMFETLDNDAIDDWLKQQRGHSFQHRIYQLERYWWTTVAAAVLIAAVSFAALRLVVPIMANIVARTMPPSVDSALAADTLSVLDKTVFFPTELAAEKRREVRAIFERMSSDIDPSRQFRLELRSSDRVGANAFALPSGVVIVTDDLIKLADDPRELQAVLSHEIGHVINRHGLRTLLQGSSATALVVAMFGDFSSVSSVITAAPILVVQSSYSREFENEADDFAYAWMQSHDVPAHFFGDMLVKIEDSAGARTDRPKGFDFLSSHPRTSDRIKKQ